MNGTWVPLGRYWVAYNVGWHDIGLRKWASVTSVYIGCYVRKVKQQTSWLIPGTRASYIIDKVHGVLFSKAMLSCLNWLNEGC